jgi:hypothetical protein
MMLSRVVEHIKRQHWLAVFIDFAIVVIGVFIGTNVSNWDEARKSQARAEAFTERLMSDLRAEHAYAVALRDYDATARKAGLAALADLAQPRGGDERRLLVDAFRASQYQWYARRRAAFDELVSSGELQLIGDAALRETAIRYYGNRATTFQLTLEAARDSDYRRRFSRLVDPDVVEALQKDCGDRPDPTTSDDLGVLVIDYACDLSVDDAAVRRTVEALRGDADLIPALRQQVTVYRVDIGNITYMLEDSGLDALIAGGVGK